MSLYVRFPAPGSAGGGSGTVTDVTATSPLFSSGGTTPNLTIQIANSTQDGYLSSVDWNTFNSKFDSPLTTKGDILGFDTTDARVPIGSDGQILTADSSQPLGLKWAAPAAVTGPANSFAGFDPSGVLGGIPNWSWSTLNGDIFVLNQGTYTIPVDGTPNTIKITNLETEFAATNPNTDQSFFNFAVDTHFDRTHGGNNAQNVTSVAISSSSEGSGTLVSNTALSVTQNFLGDSGGTTTNASSIAIGAGTAALYNIDNYRGLTLNFVADAASTVNEIDAVSIGMTSDITGNFTGFNLNHTGDVGGSSNTLLLGGNGAVTGNAFLISGVRTGTIGGSLGLLFLSQAGDITGNFQGINVGMSAGNVSSAEGVRVGFSNDMAVSKTAFTAIMGDGVTSSGGRILEASWGDGDYDNRISISINGGTGDVTTGETGINLSQSSGTTSSYQGIHVQAQGTTTGGWAGIEIDGNGTVSNADGINVNIANITASDVFQKKVFNGGGGSFNTSYDFNVPAANTFFTCNQFSSNPTVTPGNPISSLAFGNQLISSIGFQDDWTADFTGLRLGYVTVSNLSQIGGTAGKTMDSWCGMLSAATNPVGGGTLDQAIMYRAAGVLPQGGTLAVNNVYGFYGMPTLSALAPNSWGVWIGDVGADNWFAKNVVIGGVTGQPTGAYALDVIGTVKIDDGTQGAGKVFTSDAAGVGSWQTPAVSANSYYVNRFTLSGTDITNGFVTLSQAPDTASDTIATVIGGPMQDYSVDYTVTGSQLSWTGLGLDGVLIAGDKLVIQFD